MDNKTNHPHLKLLVYILILSLIFLITFAIQYWWTFVYPPLHRDQPSPIRYIESKTKSLPANIPTPTVIEHGPRNKPWVALTFDADMTYNMLNLLKRGVVKSLYNQDIKKTLDSQGVKATIFLVGLWAETYPQQAYDLAHDPLIEIGNHSYSHPAFTAHCYKLPFIDDSKDKDEVDGAQKAIVKVTGVTPKYFRFPGGCYDNIDLQTLSSSEMKVVHWDVVAGDAFNNNTESIVRVVESRVQNGSIVVFHINDGNYAPKTNQALIKIIPYLKSKGFKFVTVSEMLNSE